MRMFVWWSTTNKTPNQRFRFDSRSPSQSRWCFCNLRAFCLSFAYRSPQLDFGEPYIGTIESGFHLSLQSILLISLQLLLFTAWRPLLLRFGQWRQRPWRIWEWNWCLTGFGHWPDNLQLMLPSRVHMCRRCSSTSFAGFCQRNWKGLIHWVPCRWGCQQTTTSLHGGLMKNTGQIG